jgi:tryptophanyl-tRNA synthetase
MGDSVSGETGLKRKRVVSGMRPTGRLHIGHYFGALANWVRLQEAGRAEGEKATGFTPGQAGAQHAAPLQEASLHDRGEYECFYFIADWHALTSDYADTSGVAQNTIEITTDYLASGLDPEKSVIFLQSQVPEHAELHLLLSMITPLGWLERVPTYKEQIENVTNKDLHTYGFLGYPCLQTADIVIYSEEGMPLFVPVGEDQVSHVELSREIVRRFNSFYGFQLGEVFFHFEESAARKKLAMGLDLLDLEDQAKKVRGAVGVFTPEEHALLISAVRRKVTEIGLKNLVEGEESPTKFIEMIEVLCEPNVMLTETPRIPGLDGRKMSKSYGNAITLSETDEEIRKKTKVMKTDPARQRRTDPGNPDVCPVYDWHKLFSSADTLEWAATGCRSAGIGCIECKAKMADGLIAWIAPVRERRVEYEKHPARVLEILDAGSKRARVEAVKTMERVREAVFGWKRKREEIHAGFTEVHDSHG